MRDDRCDKVILSVDWGGGSSLAPPGNEVLSTKFQRWPRMLLFCGNENKLLPVAVLLLAMRFVTFANPSNKGFRVENQHRFGPGTRDREETVKRKVRGLQLTLWKAFKIYGQGPTRIIVWKRPCLDIFVSAPNRPLVVTGRAAIMTGGTRGKETAGSQTHLKFAEKRRTERVWPTKSFRLRQEDIRAFNTRIN